MIQSVSSNANGSGGTKQPSHLLDLVCEVTVDQAKNPRLTTPLLGMAGKNKAGNEKKYTQQGVQLCAQLLEVMPDSSPQQQCWELLHKMGLTD